MKKIIAILLALSMMFVFVACGGNEEEPTTTNNSEEATSDQAVNSGDVDVEEDTTGEDVTEEPVTDNEEDKPASDKKPTADDKEEETTERALPSDPAKWTKAEIVSEYIKAATKTHPTAKSSQTMTMPKLVVNDGDGAFAFFLNMIKPVINTVLKNNTMTFNGVTGGFTKLTPSDVKSAKAYKDGKYTVIEMVMVEQTDGIYGEMQEGTVGHAINVLGNIKNATDQFPNFDIDVENADIKIHYAKPTVKVRINEKGFIEKGTWSYTAQVDIKNLNIDNLNIAKAEADIDYNITIGGGF